MLEKIAFTGFNNVTLTNVNVSNADGTQKPYRRLCFQLNDNYGNDLSENANLLKLFPDKMRSKYLRIDCSNDGLYLNGKHLEFYGENGKLFEQVGNLLNRIKNTAHNYTYSPKYLQSNKVFENMMCCIKEIKYNKATVEETKKTLPQLLNGITDKKPIIEFSAGALKICQIFSKMSKSLN